MGGRNMLFIVKSTDRTIRLSLNSRSSKLFLLLDLPSDNHFDGLEQTEPVRIKQKGASGVEGSRYNSPTANRNLHL